MNLCFGGTHIRSMSMIDHMTEEWFSEDVRMDGQAVEAPLKPMTSEGVN
jgi:hypothetical protein